MFMVKSWNYSDDVHDFVIYWYLLILIMFQIIVMTFMNSYYTAYFVFLF